MMERKIQKSYIDYGFGFPVTLLNAPMVKVRGEWTPEIDYNEISRSVLVLLSEKPVRLTGHEVKFIRLRFEMTLDKFAKRFSVSHAAVLKWEKSGDEVTKMSWALEKDIRMFVVFNLLKKAKKLAELYGELEKEKSSQKRKIKLDVSDLAA